MYDLDIILAKLRDEFNIVLSTLKKNYSESNAIALELYEASLVKNKSLYEKEIEYHETKFNMILKNIHAIYDCYTITSSQLLLQYNSNLQNTLDTLPDLNSISYISDYTYTLLNNTNEYKYTKTVELYKNDDIAQSISDGFINNPELPFYRIQHNKFNGWIGNNNKILCIAEPLDIIILYDNSNAIFYRLSTGAKLYVDTIYTRSYKSMNFEYYNNSIILVNNIINDNKIYIDIYSYDITSDFRVIYKTTTLSTDQYKSLSKFINSFKFNKYCNKTFSNNNSYIYIIQNTLLHIIKFDQVTNQYKCDIIRLYYNIIDTCESKVLLEILKNRYSKISIIDYNIQKSYIKLYIEKYEYYTLLEFVCIFNIKLDFNTILKLVYTI